MKEKEAITKWCPHSRVMASGAATAYNRYRGADIPNGTKCIASKCMLWKWTSSYVNVEGRAKDGYGNWDDAEGKCGLIKV
jgi:hypothetical protein